MANIAIINSTDGTLLSCVVAELSDYCPEGYYLAVIPDGQMWDGSAFVPIPVMGQTVTPVLL